MKIRMEFNNSCINLYPLRTDQTSWTILSEYHRFEPNRYIDYDDYIKRFMMCNRKFAKRIWKYI